jgi:FAD/FMN-containing dehydrogenase
MAENGVSAESLAALRLTVRGPVLTPAGSGYEQAPPAWAGMAVPGYEQARTLWNAKFDSRPAVIVQAMGVADVQEALRFARANDLVVAVRGGGHTPSGSSTVDGGLVIDLRLMRGAHVDPEQRVAVVAGGTLLGELDRECQAHGLATTAGTISHTGVAGLTLFGGVGRLMRKHGLTVDNVLAFDVVTADGRFLHADAESHSDLYWALRGGGGVFGVVTHFTYRLHPVGPLVYGGFLGWPLDQAKEAYLAAHAHLANVPDDLQVQFIFCTAPVAEFVPPELQGTRCMMMTATWVGPDLAEGTRQVAPLREQVKPQLDVVGEFPYAFLQAAADPLAPFGRINVGSRCGFLPDLTEDAFDIGLAQAEQFAGPFGVVEFSQMGGAVQRVDADATAVPASFREAGYFYIYGHNTFDPAEIEPGREWVRDSDAAMEPFRLPGRYVNFHGEDDEETMREAFGEERFERLLEIKAEYDPDAVLSYSPNSRVAAVS